MSPPRILSSSLLLLGMLLIALPAVAQQLCTDTCAFAHDGECDDGGPASLYDVCELGTDCGDCGPRAQAPGPTEGATCTDTCQYAHDGECDDGGPDSLFDLCELGTDCSDCGPRLVAQPIRPPTGIDASTLCTNTCQFANDSECDDGGPGSLYDLCDLGSDCQDCGPRVAEGAPGTPEPIVPDPPGDPGTPVMPAQPSATALANIGQSGLPAEARSALAASCRNPGCGVELSVYGGDLNGDGAEEYVVIDQLFWTTYVLGNNGTGYQLLGLVEAGHGYVSVSMGSAATLGYWDIAFSGQLVECQTAITLRFNGLLYEQLPALVTGCND